MDIMELINKNKIKKLAAQTEEITNVKLPLKADKLQEEWKPVTLVNGWTQAGIFPVMYRKDGFGTVEVKGRITGGVAGTVAFNLPEGYRPPATYNAVMILNANYNTNYSFVTSTGDFQAQSGEMVNINTIFAFPTT